MASQTSTAPDLERFVAAFDDVKRAVRRARSRAADQELSLSQYDLLLPLLDGPPMGLRALADAARVASPTATRMVEGLVRRGLVTRERCEDDRRAVRLSLTTRGEELVRARRARVVAARRAAWDKLGARDREAAPRVLRAIAEAYEEMGAAR